MDDFKKIIIQKKEREDFIYCTLVITMIVFGFWFLNNSANITIKNAKKYQDCVTFQSLHTEVGQELRLNPYTKKAWKAFEDVCNN